jgi:hypothetical protein
VQRPADGEDHLAGKAQWTFNKSIGIALPAPVRSGSPARRAGQLLRGKAPQRIWELLVRCEEYFNTNELMRLHCN